MRFDGKVFMVTGAASGMGLLTCQCAVKEGGYAAMCDVNPEAAQEQADRINEEYPGRAVALRCDVLDYAQVVSARDETVRRFGSIDVLCNFAGGSATRIKGVPGELEFPDVPIEVYDWGLDVNLKGQMHMAHAVTKQMREQKSGVIVNIGSITGEEGSAKSVDYAAAKSGAMYGLTKSLAQFGGKHGIRCVCVSPGPVLTRTAMARMKTLMGRAAEPQEIVDFVLYLCSEQGAFATGVNFLVDGGRNVMHNKT